MNILRDAVAGAIPASANTCLRIEGMSPSVRIVSNPTTTLVLVAAPVSTMKEVLGALRGPTTGPANVADAFVYGLVGRRSGRLGLDLAARIGSTERAPRFRLLRHLSAPPIPAVEQFFVVAGRTAGILTPELARALESELAKEAGAANRYAVVGSYEFPTLTATSRLVIEQWIGQLRLMLADAGLPILDVVEDAAPSAGEAEVLRSGYTLSIPAGLRESPDHTYWERRCGEVRARAICTPQMVVIEAGARGRATSLPSHQICLKRKFDQLRKRRILMPVPGKKHLVEAVRPFGVPSLLNGARLFEGTNLSEHGFRRIG